MRTIQQALDHAALGYRVDEHKGLVVYKLKNTHFNMGVSPELCLIMAMFEVETNDFFAAQKAGVFPPIDLTKRDT